MKNFNWEDFKNGKIAVHCDTEEKANDFFKECYKNDINWVYGRKTNDGITKYKVYKDETCYCCFRNHKSLEYSNKEFYESVGKIIIKWDMDTMKELNFQEVIANIKEGEVWESGLSKIKMIDGNIEIEYKYTLLDKEYRFDKRTSYKLQRKEYGFIEAFKAYGEGKEIESKQSRYRYKKINQVDKYYSNSNKEWTKDYSGFSFEEINNDWYIND